MAEKALVKNKSDVKRKISEFHVHKTKTYPSTNTPVARILHLQRTIGNQAVQRLVESGILHAKLRIGQLGDIYEQEADKVADAVMRMPEPENLEEIIVSKQALSTQMQMKCTKCEEKELRRQSLEEKEEEIQTKMAPDSESELNPGLEAHINAFQGGDQPLPESVRAFFEPRFDYDFSNVRIHTDTRAAEVAQAVNARAFTLGNNVVFGEGEYAPETSSGKLLIAHELTHTIQQGTDLKREPKFNRLLTAPMQIARQGVPNAGAQPPPCPVAPLTSITDPDALAMEGGATVIWNHTSPGLQTAANRLVDLINAEPGGSANITSAYRPQAYQSHLREVWDKARALQSNTSPECAAVRTAVDNEMAHHSLNINRPVAAVSNHTAGNAVDIGWRLPNAANEETRIDELANQAGLTHPLHARDRPHFEL